MLRGINAICRVEIQKGNADTERGRERERYIYRYYMKLYIYIIIYIYYIYLHNKDHMIPPDLHTGPSKLGVIILSSNKAIELPWAPHSKG
jgi:hypothetical protein